jgi:2-polyprenyl-6-methoxyphenol hydroxylase-like FAD-dependent oxidoreductase
MEAAMRVGIVGAGPAGLYAGYLIKSRRPEAEVVVVEQNLADATFGFGVVLSDQALDFLREGDPGTVAAIDPHLVRWSDVTLAHAGERIRIDGIGFTAIGRLQLLQLLQARAASVGVVPRYGTALADLDAFSGFDLVIGADGVNSLVRRCHAADFGADVAYLSNRFAWFGTRKPFETLTQTFRRTPSGAFNAHHYRYSGEMSTFIVEVDESTFANGHLAAMSEGELRRVCEETFSEALDGWPLISNNSVWRQFPQVRNERWHHGNRVLVGDALHTAHFSIGSGTRLALEDVMALVRALDEHGWRIDAALPAYEQARRPIVEKLVAAATASARWYERFATHMELGPWEFALSYITRSGRIPTEKLRALSPRFVKSYEAAKGQPLEAFQ